MNAIEVQGLTKKYPGFTLDRISFTVPQGCIMGLIGENGAGKTTTLKALLHLIRRDSGAVRLLGKDPERQEIASKEDVGVVFEESGFHEMLNTKDVSSIMRRVFRHWDEALFQNYLDRYELPRKQAIKEYSRGMRMKLSIAAAMAHHPRLLILDEATSGLDPVVRNEILDDFLEFIQDEAHTILLSSHLTEDLEKIADYITFLHKGKLVFTSEKDILLERYGILHCGANEARQIDPADVAGRRDNAFGCDFLVRDKALCRKKYRGVAVDNASLEEMMLFYLKKGRKGEQA